LIDASFGSDLAPMAVDDPPNGRESDPGAFELFREMQTLKYAEQLIDILHVEAGAIIPHEHLDVLPALTQPISISALSRMRVNLTALERMLAMTSLSIERSP
jgi:hypothetical protein